MEDDLEQGPSSEAGAVETPAATSAARIEPAGEPEADGGPVVLADAMCGAFCSIGSPARLA